MDRNAILDRLTPICRDVFEDDTLAITEETCADDIEIWDSLMHLTLISEIEAAFGISLSLEETEKKEICALVDAIAAHLSD